MGLGKVDTFGQTFFFKSSAYRIVIGIDKVFETVSQPQHKQNSGIVAQGDTWIALFYTSKRGTRDKGSLCHKRRGDTPPLTGIANVCSKLLECHFHWPRQWGCGFHERNMYHIVSKNKKYEQYMSHYEKYRVHSNPK